MVNVMKKILLILTSFIMLFTLSGCESEENYAKIYGVVSKNDIREINYQYKKDLNNPIVLGYLTHLIADYYWNYLTFSKYTAVNERGEIIGVLRNENEFLKGGNGLRKFLKQKDFANLDKEIVKSGNYQLPSFSDDCMKDLKVIEETTYNSEDILKIIEYLKKMVETKNKEQIDEYELFTREKIKEYYFKSIEFIVDILSNIDMLS